MLSPEQEGFRADRSCSRAITHVSIYIEDAHTHSKDILLCYSDVTDVFPSTDHSQLTRVLHFPVLPEDFIVIIANIYNGATTSSLTPLGRTANISVLRGTLQGDPLTPSSLTLWLSP